MFHSPDRFLNSAYDDFFAGFGLGGETGHFSTFEENYPVFRSFLCQGCLFVAMGIPSLQSSLHARVSVAEHQPQRTCAPRYPAEERQVSGSQLLSWIRRLASWMSSQVKHQKQLSPYSRLILRHLAFVLWESSQSLTSPHGYKLSALSTGVAPRRATKARYSSESSTARRSASESGMKNSRPSAERAVMPVDSSSSSCSSSFIPMRHPPSKASNSSMARSSLAPNYQYEL